MPLLLALTTGAVNRPVGALRLSALDVLPFCVWSAVQKLVMRHAATMQCHRFCFYAEHFLHFARWPFCKAT